MSDLDPIREVSAGLTDLCPEHLRQGIRHLQRNCDIECNVHGYDWEACKQPGRYDGERMANALAIIPNLLAALDAALNLHAPRTEGSDEPYCRHCHQSPYGHAPYPCPTVEAITAALGGGQ